MLTIGSHLVSADADSKILLWSTVSQESLTPSKIKGTPHTTTITSIATDGVSLYSASIDGVLKKAMPKESGSSEFEYVAEKKFEGETIEGLVAGKEKVLVLWMHKNVLALVDSDSLESVKRVDTAATADFVSMAYSKATNEVWVGDK